MSNENKKVREIQSCFYIPKEINCFKMTIVQFILIYFYLLKQKAKTNTTNSQQTIVSMIR